MASEKDNIFIETEAKEDSVQKDAIGSENKHKLEDGGISENASISASALESNPNNQEIELKTPQDEEGLVDCESNQKQVDHLLKSNVDDISSQGSDNQDDKIELRWDDDDDEQSVSFDSDLKKDVLRTTDEQTVAVNINLVHGESESSITKNVYLEAENNSSILSSDGLFMSNAEHGLNKPDVMLEIPTQELIECSDEEDDLTNKLEMSPDPDDIMRNDNSPDEEISEKIDDIVKNIDTIAEASTSLNLSKSKDSKEKTASDEELLLENDELKTHTKGVDKINSLKISHASDNFNEFEDSNSSDEKITEKLECKSNNLTTENIMKVIDSLVDVGSPLSKNNEQLTTLDEKIVIENDDQKIKKQISSSFSADTITKTIKINEVISSVSNNFEIDKIEENMLVETDLSLEKENDELTASDEELLLENDEIKSDTSNMVATTTHYTTTKSHETFIPHSKTLEVDDKDIEMLDDNGCSPKDDKDLTTSDEEVLLETDELKTNVSDNIDVEKSCNIDGKTDKGNISDAINKKTNERDPKSNKLLNDNVDCSVDLNKHNTCSNIDTITKFDHNKIVNKLASEYSNIENDDVMKITDTSLDNSLSVEKNKHCEKLVVSDTEVSFLLENAEIKLNNKSSCQNHALSNNTSDDTEKSEITNLDKKSSEILASEFDAEKDSSVSVGAILSLDETDQRHELLTSHEKPLINDKSKAHDNVEEDKILEKNNVLDIEAVSDNIDTLKTLDTNKINSNETKIVDMVIDNESLGEINSTVKETEIIVNLPESENVPADKMITDHSEINNELPISANQEDFNMENAENIGETSICNNTTLVSDKEVASCIDEPSEEDNNKLMSSKEKSAYIDSRENYTKNELPKAESPIKSLSTIEEDDNYDLNKTAEMLKDAESLGTTINDTESSEAEETVHNPIKDFSKEINKTAQETRAKPVIKSNQNNEEILQAKDTERNFELSVKVEEIDTTHRIDEPLPSTSKFTTDLDKAKQSTSTNEELNNIVEDPAQKKGISNEMNKTALDTKEKPVIKSNQIKKEILESDNNITINPQGETTIASNPIKEELRNISVEDNDIIMNPRDEPVIKSNQIKKEILQTEDIERNLEVSVKVEATDEPQPSTSKFLPELDKTKESTHEELKNVETASVDPTEDTDLVEMSDSLGLLAESSRVMEDDEEPDEDDDGDEDDDFDADDDNSNLMTAEHSEDSSAQQSESDQPKDVEILADDKDTNLDAEDVNLDGDDANLDVDETNIDVNDANLDDGEMGFIITDIVTEGKTDMEVDETTPEEKELANESSLGPEEVGTDETKDVTETEMDIETVKLSDTSDTELDDNEKVKKKSILKTLLAEQDDSIQKEENDLEDKNKTEGSKTNRLIMSYVDLEESSSEDDVQEVNKKAEESSSSPASDTQPGTSVNIPSDIDVICSAAGSTSDIHTKESEIVISGLPKPPPSKPARLNTSEVTIKTANNTESTLVIPEQKVKSPLNLEVFSLDSDEETMSAKEGVDELNSEEPKKCINPSCTSDTNAEYDIADVATATFYESDKKRRGFVCAKCAEVVVKRNRGLIEGIRNLVPLLDLDMGRDREDLVEISDSESEDEGESPFGGGEAIGLKGAKFLEENLANIMNETWFKFKMDTRLDDTQNTLREEMKRLQKESAEINEMLNKCQVATDQIRTAFYATFEQEIQEEPSITIYDVPNCWYTCPTSTAEVLEGRLAKRRASNSFEPPAKRPAIPLGYAPLDSSNNQTPKTTPPEKIDDDNTDISVVKLSAELAPADLPPPGEVLRTPLKVGDSVYAMRNAFGTWLKAKVAEIFPKVAVQAYTTCRVRFEHKTVKNQYKTLPMRCLAYDEPAKVRMTIGTRVIALFKQNGMRHAFYSGVVAEMPNPVNNYRYLIFFDDGYAQYAPHSQTRLVCECSPLVWEEVHPYSREFVRQYLLAYPERPMVRLHAGQNLKTEWRGKWWASKVNRVDASLVEVIFSGMMRQEWIYRGSTRLAPLYLELQAAERQRPRALPRAQATSRTNMPYVEYTRSDEQMKTEQPPPPPTNTEEMRRQRAVAKKSSSTVMPQPPSQPTSGNLDNVTSRVVYYTPKNAVKPLKMVPHMCGPKCKRNDVLALKDLRTYNPLAKPLLSGWERQIVRWKGQKEVMYVGPCGRRIRCVRELHKYLRLTRSDMPVDLFDFSPATHCLAEFVLNRCIVAKKDLSHGKENVPIPCVNYYDESLPEFCSYNTERTPTAGVPLNLDPEFLCGCDCEDDCEDKTKCACWKLTLEGARTIGLDDDVGYVYKRLPEQLPSGIYECNSRCKCKHTCLNRVAQHPLQLKLQVFKTLNRGWGIRALNDVPKGAFLCVYAGNLLTDATATLDGLNEGDEYLAELDYIEVVEQMKEGFEEDIPDDIKKLDKKESEKQEESEEESESSSEEEQKDSRTEEDADFQPGYIGLGVMDFDKRLRKRDRGKKDKKEKKKDAEKEGNGEDCITISDDEEGTVREPSCFTAAAGMGANEFKSKYRSVRTLFGEDEACYIMDAKVQGNIGRYLNHSCCPNVFVQNVFVDSHDPRFPWVAFFALAHIRAGTELTWNYNYDVGSVPGKTLYCYCGAPNCRGRLL